MAEDAGFCPEGAIVPKLRALIEENSCSVVRARSVSEGAGNPHVRCGLCILRGKQLPSLTLRALYLTKVGMLSTRVAQRSRACYQSTSNLSIRLLCLTRPP